jgi:chromate transporter
MARASTRAGARDLLWLYTRIGNTTFGGGDPTMAALQKQLFDRQWVTREEYGLVYGLARATPGTNVIAFCAGTGWLARGLLGALLAAIGSTLPSSVIVVLLTAGLLFWRENPWALAAIAGMLAAATGLMGGAALTLLRPHFPVGAIRAAAILAFALLLTFRFDLTPIQVLGLAAIAGAIWKP